MHRIPMYLCDILLNEKWNDTESWKYCGLTERLGILVSVARDLEYYMVIWRSGAQDISYR